jgi:hypothetical protein
MVNATLASPTTDYLGTLAVSSSYNTSSGPW